MPRENDRIFELAQRISQKKGFKKAIKDYQNILEKDPTDFKTRIKLGDIYLRRGELVKAIEEYFQVGEYYIGEELDLKAIAIFKKILVMNPRMIEAYYKLAELYKSRGLLGEAKIQYQKILDLKPKEKKAQDELKQIEKKESRSSVKGKRIVEDRIRERDPVWNAILQELQRQLSSQLRDDDYQTHYHLGVAFKEMDLLQKAIDEFKIAINEPSLKFDGYLMMGICNRELGSYDEAIEYFRKGLMIKDLTKKQHEDVYYQLGLTFEEDGQTANALEAFNKVSELRGGVPSPEFQSRLERLKEQLRGS